MHSFSIIVCISALVSTVAFVTTKFSTKVNVGCIMATVQDKVIVSIEAPDFYWKYRLDRLISQKDKELSFKKENYKHVSDFKDLYDCYYLDLTLNGKLENFDWENEKKITDAEWLIIYKSIVSWSDSTYKTNKPDSSNLPANDFDLLKQFYPQLNFRELETPFSTEEVGNNFPYKSLKDLINAANNGKLSVPGYDSSSATLEATGAKKALNLLKEKTFTKLDSIYADTLAYAKNPFPDEISRTHYQELRKKLADFPQGPSGWAIFRANLDKEIDEMSRLASKKVDEHHEHGEDEIKVPTPAEEFEAKYGKNLDVLQERFTKFKADPVGFLEGSIIEKYGKSGLEVWKKSQEFSEKLSVLSDADKVAAEKSFNDFLKNA